VPTPGPVPTPDPVPTPGAVPIPDPVPTPGAVPITDPIPAPPPMPEPLHVPEPPPAPQLPEILAAPGAANPYRPEVPDIPTYDPWSVTPRSRYTDGPTYVEVDAPDDSEEHVEAIAEHHTGHAPVPDVTDADTAGSDDDTPRADV
jgi:hypothetical protein